MSRNIEAVERFIDAFNAMNIDLAIEQVAPDCVYHNIPVDPVEGPDAIRAVVQGFLGMATKVEWITHQIAESADGSVLTERTDRFLIGDRWISLPVMGIFELRDGQIAAWRDYFDMQQFQRQLPGAGGEA